MKPVENGARKVNINVRYDRLHPEWKHENLLAAWEATVAVNMYPLLLVPDAIHPVIHPVDTFPEPDRKRYEALVKSQFELAAAYLHDKWMERNPMTIDNAHQHIRYYDLDDSDKQNDRNQIMLAIKCLKNDHPIVVTLAAELHQLWRDKFDPEKTNKLRIKSNKSDGTSGNINAPFAELHPDWQEENLLAARAALWAVKHHPDDVQAASFSHKEWMRRNENDVGNPLLCPFDMLTVDEKEKDLGAVRAARRLLDKYTRELRRRDAVAPALQAELRRHCFPGDPFKVALLREEGEGAKGTDVNNHFDSLSKVLKDHLLSVAGEMSSGSHSAEPITSDPIWHLIMLYKACAMSKSVVSLNTTLADLQDLCGGFDWAKEREACRSIRDKCSSMVPSAIDMVSIPINFVIILLHSF